MAAAEARLVLLGSTRTAGTASLTDGLSAAADRGPRAARLTSAGDLVAVAVRPDADLGEAAPRVELGLGGADAEVETESGLSADATPIACGPVRDKPSANAAAPTRAVVLVLFMNFVPSLGLFSAGGCDAN